MKKVDIVKKYIIIIICILNSAFLFSQSNVIPPIDLQRNEFQVGLYPTGEKIIDKLKKVDIDKDDIFNIKLKDGQVVNTIIENDFEKGVDILKVSNTGRYIVFTEKHDGIVKFTQNKPTGVYLLDRQVNHVFKLFDSTNEINALDISSDEKLIALGTKNWEMYQGCKLYLFNLESMSILDIENIESGGFINIKFSDDSKSLMMHIFIRSLGGSYCSINFYEIEKKEPSNSINFVISENYDPELKLLAYIGYVDSKKKVILLDVEKNEVLISIDEVDKRTDRYSTSVPLVQPISGNLMYIHDIPKVGKVLEIYDRNNGELLYKGESYLKEGIHFNTPRTRPNYQDVKMYYEYLYVERDDGEIEQFNLDNISYDINSISINNDSSKIILNGKAKGSENYFIKVIDSINNRMLLSYDNACSGTVLFLDNSLYFMTYGNSKDRMDNIRHIFSIDDKEIAYLRSLYPYTYSYIDYHDNRIVISNIERESDRDLKATTNIIGTNDIDNINSIDWSIEKFYGGIATSLGSPFILGNKIIINRMIYESDVYKERAICIYESNENQAFLDFDDAWQVANFSIDEQIIPIVTKDVDKNISKILIYDINNLKTLVELPISENIRITENCKYIVQYKPHEYKEYGYLPDFLIYNIDDQYNKVPIRLNNNRIVNWDISNDYIVAVDKDGIISMIDINTGKIKNNLRLLDEDKILCWDDKNIFYATPNYSDYLIISGEGLNPVREEVITYFGRTAFVNDGPLYLRSHPGLTGEKIGLMQNEMRLYIYERTDEKTKIGEYNDYWYRVAAENGFHGWCYGAFITLEE